MQNSEGIIEKAIVLNFSGFQASVTKQRSVVADELFQASKNGGPDPQFNTHLADAITRAKKIGFPKTSIENSIARGQGRSSGGAALENVTVEAMVPPSVAVIIECQTDSKQRTLNDMRQVLKESNGVMTPTSHLFERKGKIMFENPRVIGETEIFDRAVEAGATDIEIEEGGNIVVTTEPTQTAVVANALTQSSGFKVTTSDIIWEPNDDTMVDVPASGDLDSFLGRYNDPHGSDSY
ncbi:hypothetical protein ACLMJK_001578 [Lecanora helva]